jgi:hypothetical protein
MQLQHARVRVVQKHYGMRAAGETYALYGAVARSPGAITQTHTRARGHV